MSHEALGAGAVPAEIAVLIVRATGVRLGVEAAAVDGILDAAAARHSGLACESLAGLLGVAAPREPAMVLLLKGREGGRGLGVDELEELTVLPLSALRQLPKLAVPGRCRRALWGAVVRGGAVVLLVDVDRLFEPPTARAGIRPITTGVEE